MNRLKFRTRPDGASLIALINATQQDIDAHRARIAEQMPKKPVRKKVVKK